MNDQGQELTSWVIGAAMVGAAWWLIRQINRSASMLRNTEQISPEEAMDIAAAIGIDWDVEEFPPSEFIRGINVEMEHGTVDWDTNVTYDDPYMTGKIAWAHLRELPDYYTRLEIMERGNGAR